MSHHCFSHLVRIIRNILSQLSKELHGTATLAAEIWREGIQVSIFFSFFWWIGYTFVFANSSHVNWHLGWLLPAKQCILVCCHLLWDPEKAGSLMGPHRSRSEVFVRLGTTRDFDRQWKSQEHCHTLVQKTCEECSLFIHPEPLKSRRGCPAADFPSKLKTLKSVV